MGNSSEGSHWELQSHEAERVVPDQDRDSQQSFRVLLNTGGSGDRTSKNTADWTTYQSATCSDYYSSKSWSGASNCLHKRPYQTQPKPEKVQREWRESKGDPHQTIQTPRSTEDLTVRESQRAILVIDEIP